MAKKDTTGTTGSEIVNPFNAGVTYDDFIKALPEGVSVAEYLAPLELEEHEVKWISKEIASHKYNQENKAANLARANAEHAELIKENK